MLNNIIAKLKTKYESPLLGYDIDENGITLKYINFSETHPYSKNLEIEILKQLESQILFLYNERKDIIKYNASFLTVIWSMFGLSVHSVIDASDKNALITSSLIAALHLLINGSLTLYNVEQFKYLKKVKLFEDNKTEFKEIPLTANDLDDLSFKQLQKVLDTKKNPH